MRLVAETVEWLDSPEEKEDSSCPSVASSAEICTASTPRVDSSSAAGSEKVVGELDPDGDPAYSLPIYRYLGNRYEYFKGTVSRD